MTWPHVERDTPHDDRTTTSQEASLVERFKPTIGWWCCIVALVMLAQLIVGIILDP